MKNLSKTLILAAALCMSSVTSWAATQVELDAGKLQTQNAGTFLPVGSLLQVIATRGGASGTFVAPTVGNYIGGDNLIVASFAMNNIFSTGETDNFVTFNYENFGAASPSTFDTGDAVLLRWYPTITYAQFQLGTLPTANTPYGQYRSNTGLDGGIAWFAPADGLSLGAPTGLNFETTSVPGSAGPDSLGVANLTVIPEPSTYAMVFSGFGMLVGFQRIRRRAKK